ncbi:MAG: RIP metalloprotease RseP [Zoogloeaceae bacterium]|jgi:regulator of sigma E protease|nr:RIP metalloprotease RseP [Zoogloeaceae bacterium]
MFDFFLYFFAFLFLLGILVVAHEFGHFFVARRCGIKVLRFSVGFGRTLWSRRFGRDQTELALCALPLGGYVRMLDERELEAGEHIDPKDLPRAFNRQNVRRRVAVVAAGPLLNLLLAFLLYWALFMMNNEALRPVLGAPLLDSPAAEAGIQNGDTVLAVNGRAVATLENFHWRLLKDASETGAENDALALTLRDAEGRVSERRLSVRRLAEANWEGDPFALLGLRVFQLPITPIIGVIESGSPADRAGLRAEDQILEVAAEGAANGTQIHYWPQFVDLIRRSANQPLAVTVRRADATFVFHVTPEDREGQGRLGAGVAKAEVDKVGSSALRVTVRYGVLEAAGRALSETWDKSVFSLVMLWRMVTGDVSWKNLSGPLMIADYAGKTASMGAAAYLKFMALVSIGLGILNLLPIPILDGGHLLYYALEIVKGSPVSERFAARGQRFGMAILLFLMIFALFNDVNRLL